MTRAVWMTLAVAAAVAGPVAACSLCLSVQQSSTFRQEATQAKLILAGAMENGNPGAGTTDLRVETVLKDDPFRKNAAVVKIPRYLPTDPKAPERYLVFCDVFNDKLDPYRGVPIKSKALVEYVKGAMALDPKDRSAHLLYCFDFLEHTDRDVATDAFLEFAKATDQEVGRVAAKLDASKLRVWVKDERTPPERLGLYAFLLGACGGAEDAALLRSMATNPTDRTAQALDGLLGGYIQLRPKEGWELLYRMLRDDQQPFTARYALVRTLRFFHGWKPEETRPMVLRGMAVIVPQGDLADLGVEDLRRWQMWDLTDLVLAQYDKKSHDIPIVKRTLLRYALCCPKPEAAAFVGQKKKAEPELFKEVEDSLAFERMK